VARVFLSLFSIGDLCTVFFSAEKQTDADEDFLKQTDIKSKVFFFKSWSFEDHGNEFRKNYEGHDLSHHACKPHATCGNPL